MPVPELYCRMLYVSKMTKSYLGAIVILGLSFANIFLRHRYR